MCTIDDDNGGMEWIELDVLSAVAVAVEYTGSDSSKI